MELTHRDLQAIGDGLALLAKLREAPRATYSTPPHKTTLAELERLRETAVRFLRLADGVEQTGGHVVLLPVMGSEPARPQSASAPTTPPPAPTGP